MLHTSCIDPSKLAYEVLEGPHDFSHHPWAPPGCRAIIHEPTYNRTLWGPRGADAWYIGPASHHYRSYEFYVPDTRAYQISASAQFFPTYCEILSETPTQDAAHTAAKLIIELQQQCNESTNFDLSRQQRAIKIIKEIYQFNNQWPPREEEPGAEALRVEPTLSSNPTAPRTLKTAKQTHNHVTRNNTPGLVSIPTWTR